MTGHRLIPRSFDSRGNVQMAESRWSSMQDGLTPIDALFVVHHYDAPPAAEPATATIELLDGDGATRSWSVADLAALGPVTERAVIECAGMSRGFLPTRVPGTQWGHGMVGAVEWTGVPLARLLEASGCDLHGTSHVIVEGADSGTTQPENVHAVFAKGLPLEKALHPSTLLAWEANGEPLPHEHGGPIRLVVPGWYGIWWAKWVRRIELSRSPFAGFWQAERYTYQEPDGSIREVVGEQLPRAMILDPAEADMLRGAGRVAVSGLAWAGEHPVDSVDVTVDDGETWHRADLAPTESRWMWARWSIELDPGPPTGVRRIAARATDASGRSQEWASRPNRLGYGNNGIHSVTVDLRAGD